MHEPGILCLRIIGWFVRFVSFGGAECQGDGHALGSLRAEHFLQSIVQYYIVLSPELSLLFRLRLGGRVRGSRRGRRVWVLHLFVLFFNLAHYLPYLLAASLSQSLVIRRFLLSVMDMDVLGLSDLEYSFSFPT